SLLTLEESSASRLCFLCSAAQGSPSAPHPPAAALAGLLRDLFVNPFCPLPAIDPLWLAWNERTIPRLAEAAYDNRLLPSGELARARLAILADALEEVGADP